MRGFSIFKINRNPTTIFLYINRNRRSVSKKSFVERPKQALAETKEKQQRITTDHHHHQHQQQQQRSLINDASTKKL